MAFEYRVNGDVVRGGAFGAVRYLLHIIRNVRKGQNDVGDEAHFTVKVTKVS